MDADFRGRYEAGRGVVRWCRGAADLETPVGAYLKLSHGSSPSFLLESVEGNATRGRYSVIGLRPDLIWRCVAGRAEINRAARQDPLRFEPDPGAAFDSLRALIAESQLDLASDLPPMTGGLFGYMGYDMAHQMEALPDFERPSLGLPDAILIRPSLYAIFDNVRD